MDKSNLRVISKLMLKLMPIQILLAAVSAVNNIVTSYFASNYIGISAMSAVGLYSPISMLMGALSTLFAGGCAIICGKYLGRNENDKIQNFMSLDLIISSITAALFIAFFVIVGTFDLTWIFTNDPAIKPVFSRYILWQALGVLPFMLGNQLAPFLAMENRSKRTLAASLAFIIANLVFDDLFIKVFKLEELGLALASSLGLWVFFLVEAQYFTTKRSMLKLRVRSLDWKDLSPIFVIGFPGAASYLYQTARGLILNGLLEVHSGSMGISAYAATNNFMGLFWAVPSGMLAVSRLVMSVSLGEEDRQSLVDVMRVMFRRFIPIVIAMNVFIALCAHPFTWLFFKDTSMPAYGMMVSGLRIIPWCMSFSVIYMHFACYGQAIERHLYVNVLAFLDGVACVAGFTALLIGSLGIDAVYVSNIMNGLVTTLVIIGYAWIKKKRFPKDAEDLMVVPENFGAAEEDRIDISIRTKEEVVSLSDKIRDFCTSKGIDKKRSYYAALALEEMAGNIVEHGFEKDSRKHSIDVRVVYKDGDVILRIKDDCIPFDPGERTQISANDDITKNIGIRMVYSLMKEIDYQNILGLNVLTIKI